MQRANDSNNQTTSELKSTVSVLSQRVNQLERLLDGKEIREARFESGEVYQRTLRLSLNNGLVATEWVKADVDGNVTSLVAGTAISLSPATGVGDVTVTNTGVTSAAVSLGLTISAATGAVTISLPSGSTQSQVLSWSGSTWAADWTRWV